MAEYYHIYDYRALPVETLAVLVFGLRDDSRTKQNLLNMAASRNTMLLAAIFDKLSLLLWLNTKDAKNGQNRPKSLLDMLTSNEKKDSDNIVFDSSEDYEAARARILNREV